MSAVCSLAFGAKPLARVRVCVGERERERERESFIRRACFHPSHTKTALKRIFSPPQGGSDPPVVEFSIITGKV